MPKAQIYYFANTNVENDNILTSDLVFTRIVFTKLSRGSSVYVGLLKKRVLVKMCLNCNERSKGIYVVGIFLRVLKLKPNILMIISYCYDNTLISDRVCYLHCVCYI